MAADALTRLGLPRGDLKTIKIADFVAPDRVISRLPGMDKLSILKELAHLGAAFANLDPAQVFEALLEREDSTTIGLGRGMAIPHATAARASHRQTRVRGAASDKDEYV